MLKTVEGKELSVTFFGTQRNVKIYPEVTHILRMMQEDFADFYLTGSFSIKGREPEDIDFFTLASNELRAALVSHGFNPVFGAYGDSSFQEVLVFNAPHNFWGDYISQIHVQLIYPWLLDKKIAAQRKFEQLSPYLREYLTKDRMRSLWEILMD